MNMLDTLFSIWVVVGFVFGIGNFDYFYRKIKLGGLRQKIWVTFYLGPFWWIMMPVASFVIRWLYGTKYFEITPVPARHFKRQFFYNGNILTVVDGNLSYAWLLNKREDEMFKKRWSDEGVLFLKKYYDKNKKLRYTILMFDL